jgi:hypothetical protein
MQGAIWKLNIVLKEVYRGISENGESIGNATYNQEGTTLKGIY